MKLKNGLSFGLLLLGLFGWNLTLAQSTKNSSGRSSSEDKDIRMYLEIGTLSEIIIPEPYTTVQIPVQIVEMRDVPGRNQRVITVHPIVAQRTKTNIRIYTAHYNFNIKLYINWLGRTPTETLDLEQFIGDVKPFVNPPPTKAGNGAGNGSANGSGKVHSKVAGSVDLDGPAVPADFTLDNLSRVKPDLLQPNKHAPAIVKNRVVFAVDHIFHHKGKMVFKATLWNKSGVPYNILDLTITYKEKRGIPAINRRETKSLTLMPFHEYYTLRSVPPGEKSHIIYVTSKLSPQDTGSFNCLLVERNGTRNFVFDIPSYVE